MYDDLNDPNPPAPGPEQRAGVARRAARIRRRRQGAWTAGTAVVAVLSVLLVSGGGEPPVDRLDSAAGDPTESAAPSAYPTAEPSAEPTRPSVAPSRSAAGGTPSRTAPTPDPSPSRTGPTRPRTSAPTSPTPSQSVAPGDMPDGKPGWDTGYSWCRTAQLGESTAPDPAMSVTLDLDEHSVAAGRPVRGRLSVVNNGSQTLSFNIYGDAKGSLVDSAGQPRSAVHGQDAVATRTYSLSPGAALRFPVEIATTECGDTSRDPEPALRAGSYQALAWLRWATRGGNGVWYADPLDVTLT